MAGTWYGAMVRRLRDRGAGDWSRESLLSGAAWQAGWLAVVALAVVFQAPAECYVAIVAILTTASVSMAGSVDEGRERRP